MTVSDETNIAGRGTEEMKTNDVTNRFTDINYIGLSVDVGRPNVGCRLKDVEKITQALAKSGVQFEKENPSTSLMENLETGNIKKDVIEEKVFSCVIECMLPIEKLPEIIYTLKKVGEKVNCL